LKIQLAIICTLIATASFAQQKGIYFFDAYWQTTSEKNAFYLVRHKKLADNTLQMDYYNYKGPLVKTETFTNNKATIRQGRSTYYDRNGRIDSTGFYQNNQRDKSWYYYSDTDTAKITKIVDYQNGKIIKVTDPSQDKIDTATGDARVSEFPGGLSGWISFLNKEFRYPKRAVQNDIQGQVRILFEVNTDGKIENPVIYKSVELSVDDESLRVLNATPAWIPAEKNGKKVKSFMVQPLSFRLVAE
jgi:protein TonB